MEKLIFLCVIAFLTVAAALALMIKNNRNMTEEERILEKINKKYGRKRSGGWKNY